MTIWNLLAREVGDLARISGGTLAFLIGRNSIAESQSNDWIDATEDDLERGIHTGSERPSGGMVDHYGQTEFMVKDNLFKG